MIRPAVGGDIAGVSMLVGQYWQFEGIDGFEPSRIESLLHGLLASPQHGSCWIKEEGGSVGAYLLAVYLFSLEHGGLMAEIDELFVTPPLRAAGIGSSLLAAAERDMAALGVVRVQLQLGVRNHQARRFYERHGFSLRLGYKLLEKPL